MIKLILFGGIIAFSLGAITPVFATSWETSVYWKSTPEMGKVGFGVAYDPDEQIMCQYDGHTVTCMGFALNPHEQTQSLSIVWFQGAHCLTPSFKEGPPGICNYPNALYAKVIVQKGKILIQRF